MEQARLSFDDVQGVVLELTKASRRNPDGRAGRALAALRTLLSWQIDTEYDVNRYKRWIMDMQCGVYVNCVYCGHRYGPVKTTPATMGAMLKAHIEKCPEHPLAASKAELQTVRAELDRVRSASLTDLSVLITRAGLAERRVAELGDLLRRYGGHGDGCFDNPCTCGLSNALSR